MSETYWFVGTHNRILLDAAVTGGAYDLLEQVAEPGHQPPPHVHDHCGEGWVVLEGEITVSTAAGETVVPQGEAIFSPAGEAHTFKVTSEGPARMLVATVPAGFVDFVRAFGEPASDDELPPQSPPDLDRLVAVAAEHGIRMLPSLEPAVV